MISLREVSAGVFGAWRLAHGDRSGLNWFDATANGAARSFWAGVIALPAYIVLLGLEFSENPVNAGPMQLIMVYAISYVLDWASFPLAMRSISTSMGKGKHYYRYVSALNWARVVEVAVFLPAAILGSMSSNGMFALIPVILLIAILIYHGFIAVVALEASKAEAGMVVPMNLGLSIIISLWARSLVS